jgi:hypothetical protein
MKAQLRGFEDWCEDDGMQGIGVMKKGTQWEAAPAQRGYAS